MRQETDEPVGEAPGPAAGRAPNGSRSAACLPRASTADLWENFSRRWQGLPSQGGEQARLALGSGHQTDGLAGSQRDRRQPDPGQAGVHRQHDRMAATQRALISPPARMCSWWCASTPASATPKAPRWPMWYSQALPDIARAYPPGSRRRPGQHLRPGGDRRPGPGVHHHGRHGNGDERRAGDRRRADPLPRERLYPGPGYLGGV